MNKLFRNQILKHIEDHLDADKVIKSLEYDSETLEGTIEYKPDAISIPVSTPGFTGSRTKITDEEVVRAFITLRLVSELQYKADNKILEFERKYKAVGRPGKGGRVDILVKHPKSEKIFLFIECKAPDKFDSDLCFVDGQLFRLSKQEKHRPANLVYYTVEFTEAEPHERILLVDTSKFPEFEDWDEAGQPIVDSIPPNYKKAKKRRYAKVEEETSSKRPLRYDSDSQAFSRLRNEIHDVIWGGGGTTNNEVFVYISKLILCKIFDEQETNPGDDYEFQRLGDAEEPEPSDDLMARMNALYRRAEKAYLALPTQSEGPAFEIVRVPSAKIAYVVGRLEGISVTRNLHHGDILGDFFEQIVSQDFTQSKGQFFTPPKVVRFMLALADVTTLAKNVLRKEKDHLGRPRLPYVVDPSCGSGTFLIEYMKTITAALGSNAYRKSLPDRISDIHAVWFGGRAKNVWAKDFLFGIENNYDLGLAAKVNMVLHGDGSMNTYIRSGLLPFPEYWVDGRHNVLGVSGVSQVLSYAPCVNEQFDFLISNPPFSLTASPDEKRMMEQAFNGQLRISEVLFVERWYQLLRPGGAFCTILPENILDTKANKTARLFFLKHFKIEAIVSLPYDAFKPFTSTKTCIVYAVKCSAGSIAKWDSALAKITKEKKITGDPIPHVLSELGLSHETIFMAEPQEIGYKRRKNLPDLERPNYLYREDSNGYPENSTVSKTESVLDYWNARTPPKPHPQLGFRVALAEVVSRPAFRMDPKYCWLWYFEAGSVSRGSSATTTLGDILAPVELQKLKKQSLPDEAPLIDLDLVPSRQGTLSELPPIVDEIGSDRVSFAGADLLFSKLEPYLGKVLIDFPPNAIGSPEWIGFKVKPGIPKHFAGYILMHPAFCEAFRRLQSGKRHARLDPEEMLELKFELQKITELKKCDGEITRIRTELDFISQQRRGLRNDIDELISKSAKLRAQSPVVEANTVFTYESSQAPELKVAEGE